MAELAVLERQTDYVETQKREHKKRIAENYRRLLEGNVTQAPADAMPSPVREPVREERPAPATRPAEPERIAPRMPSAPASAATLFDNVVYRGGTPVQDAPAQTLSPAQTLAPADAMSEEDAMPTARTMDTIRRPAAQTEAEALAEGTKVSFFQALSTRMKVALAVVAAVIVIAFVAICVNTALLGSLDASIASKQLRLGNVTQQVRQLENKIEDITDTDSVQEWAEGHGMVKD